MRYYNIGGDMEEVDSWFLAGPRHIDGTEMAPLEFHQGNRLPYDRLEVAVLREGKRNDISWTPHDVFVVSPRAGAVFEEWVKDGVQLIPCKSTGGDELFVVNTLVLLDCIDHTRSKYSRYPKKYPLPHCAGQIEILWTLALQADVVRGHHLFRLLEHSMQTLISEELFDHFKGLGMQGMGIDPLPEIVP